MFSQLTDAHWKQLKEGIFSEGVTTAAAIKAQSIQRAYNKKMTRVTHSIQQNNAIAHIAYVSGKDRWENPVNVPVGFIFSHGQISAPLDEHLEELKTEFPELDGKTRDELSKCVLSGEHGYVVPEFQNRRIGDQLIKAHEQEAQLGISNRYTHRMISLWAPEAHLEEMLSKKGYHRLAVRSSGAVIMAKKLKATTVSE